MIASMPTRSFKMTLVLALLTALVRPARATQDSPDIKHHSKKVSAKKKPAKNAKAHKSPKKSRKKQSKVLPKTPKPQAKVAPQANLEQLDKICRHDQSWGKIQALRMRCADLEPRNSAVATYWRLTLSDDPNDLRKGFAPATLGKQEVDSRLILSAGRYHFARGQATEMEDLVEIARKQKLDGPEIDTLKRLAAGK